MNNKSNEYQAPISVDDHQPVLIEALALASPWRRIAAYLINIVLLLLCFFGFAAILQPNAFAFYLRSVTLTEVLNLNFLVSPVLFANMYFDMVMGSVLVLILGIVQMVLISIKGQSIGKIIMGIKVVKVTGEQAGLCMPIF